jgi:CubicO group peptidase (beta-lactamase class C family)
LENFTVSTLRGIGSLAGIVVGVVLTLACIGAADAAAARDVPWPAADWQQGTPASVGLDAKTLAGLDADFAAGKYALVDSFQVFRCGKEVFERKYAHDYPAIYAKEAKVKGPLNARLTGPYNYFDPAWHPYYHGTDLHTMQSITKTVTSVILGIAMTRGDFKGGLNTPVLSYFDATKVKHVDARKRGMTLKHVLTMTAGLEWEEDVPYDDPRNDASLMEATDDWVEYVIDKPMAADPGTVFKYSSGASELLAYIFQRGTGQDIESYGEQHLFAPLGIRHYWKRNYQGMVDTEGGLFLTGADLAKIGYLYLHDGSWGGKRIVSREWVRQSLRPFADTGWQGLKYGYKWWLYPRKDSGQYVWMGIGFGGQRLMVFAREQLIATFTGWDILKDPELDAQLANRLLPAVVGTSCPAAAR